MLPNFLIVGTQKAATTWLANSLGEHPDVFMVDIKETHYFNHDFDKGLGWYENFFKEWTGQAAVGEATPGYLNSVDAPHRIRSTLGDQVKLIASLRHPVERAYSAFWHFKSRGDIPANTDFRQAFLHGDQLGLGQYGLLDRSNYFEHLSRYFNHFSRQNFLILIYEEALSNKPETIKRCLGLLNVDAQFIPNKLDNKINKGRNQRVFHRQAVTIRRKVARQINTLVPPGMRQPFLSLGRWTFENLIFSRLPEKQSYKPLASDLRQELLSDFMPGIKQLEDLLERDLSIWYESSKLPIN